MSDQRRQAPPYGIWHQIYDAQTGADATCGTHVDKKKGPEGAAET